AADAETVEDLVLAVDQPRCIGALKQSDLLAAMRTLLVGRVDLLFAAETGDGAHRSSGSPLSGLSIHNCKSGRRRSGPHRPVSGSRARLACCSRTFRWLTSDLRASSPSRFA